MITAFSLGYFIAIFIIVIKSFMSLSYNAVQLHFFDTPCNTHDIFLKIRNTIKMA